MKVIGITGTNGAGKGTVVELLQKKFHCIHLSARQMILDLAKTDGIDITDRSGLREYNEQRNREGKSLIDEIDKKYNTQQYQHTTFVFESIRRVSEINQLRKLFGTDFILLGVDAEQPVRYERAVLRNSMSDKVTFEQFMEHEKLESVSQDDYQMNLPKCIEQADFVIQNDGSFEDLEKQVHSLTEKYKDFFPQQ